MVNDEEVLLADIWIMLEEIGWSIESEMIDTSRGNLTLLHCKKEIKGEEEHFDVRYNSAGNSYTFSCDAEDFPGDTIRHVQLTRTVDVVKKPYMITFIVNQLLLTKNILEEEYKNENL